MLPPEGRCEEEEVVQKSPYSKLSSNSVHRQILLFYSAPVKVEKCIPRMVGSRLLSNEVPLDSREDNFTGEKDKTPLNNAKK